VTVLAHTLPLSLLDSECPTERQRPGAEPEPDSEALSEAAHWHWQAYERQPEPHWQPELSSSWAPGRALRVPGSMLTGSPDLGKKDQPELECQCNASTVAASAVTVARGGAHLPIEAHAAIFPLLSPPAPRPPRWPGRVQMKRRLLKYDLSTIHAESTGGSSRRW
jgi:hypothetical protein